MQEELRGDDKALPLVNPAAFAEKAIVTASKDRQLMSDAGTWTFFDRGLVDAAVALQQATGIAAAS